jgi:hypothetical protein
LRAPLYTHKLGDAGGAVWRSPVMRAPWDSDVAAAPAEPSVMLAEPRVSKQTFAAQVGMSVRWVEQKIKAGMPAEYAAGRVVMYASAGEAWLRENGHLTTTPPARPNRG